MVWWALLAFGIGIIPIRPIAGTVIAVFVVVCVVVGGTREFRDPTPDAYMETDDIDKEDRC